jgi:hypothetical protein
MAKDASKAELKLTAGNLKDALWETLQQVKSGQMDAGNADAVATQAREIVRTANLQLRVAQQTKRPVPVDVLNFSENA